MKLLIKICHIILISLFIFPAITFGLSTDILSLKNSKYTFTIDKENGTWSCKNNTGETIFNNAEFLIIANSGEKYYSSSEEYSISSRKSSFTDELGDGEKIEVKFASDDDSIPDVLLSLCLYNNKNYLSFEVEVINQSSENISIREIQPLILSSKNQGCLQVNGTPGELSCLIDGYSPGNESKVVYLNETKSISGYTTTAIFNRESKESIICGFLENSKSVNLISLKVGEAQNNGITKLSATLSSYFDYCPLKKGESLSTGKILLSMPDNVFEGLENYAALMAKINDIKIGDAPLTGWCSWYYIYPDITEQEVLLNTNFLSGALKDYGLEYIQIDRGRIPTGTDWLVNNSKFPHSMKWLSGYIHDKGFKAGIWTAPYWLGRKSAEYNKDWLLYEISKEPKQEGGRRRHWASFGDVLDTSNPEVTEYMKAFVDTLVNSWDYDYLKNDFLQYGIPEIRKLDLIFAEHGEITGVDEYPRHNKSITPFEAYKKGVAAIREAAGEDTFIMGCGAPLFHSAGFMNAARVGGDIQSKLCNTWECGTAKTVRTSAKRYYYNGRTMWIDPDGLVIGDPCGRGSFTYDQSKVRVSLASMFGGMLMMSDRMYTLPDEKIDMLKKVIPAYPVAARPLDLFETELPEIWQWEIAKDFGNWNVLGVFNYSDTVSTRDITYDYLGLDSTKEYLVYDFWNSKLMTRSSRYNFRSLMPFDKKIFFEVAPQSCIVISIREKLDRPQVISTNRHLTQGAISLDGVEWDAESLTLSGYSKLVKNDNYELVLSLPAGLDVSEAVTNDNNVSCSAELSDPDVDRYNTVIVKMKSPENKKVKWEVSFKDYKAVN